MLFKKSLFVLLMVNVVSSIGLVGCASDLDADTYSRDQVRQVATIDKGVIRSLAGGGHGHLVSAVIGAVAGGLLGEATQEGLTKAKGVEITIQKDSGQEISIVQQVQQNQIFRVGDRVRILQEGNTTRVELDQ